MSSKRKAESQEGKLSKDDDKKGGEHIYFEPKFCCDLILVYEDTTFHVHKSIMAREARYFYNLLQTIIDGGGGKEEPIILPTVKNINGQVSKSISYNHWLQLLYERTTAPFTDFFYHNNEPGIQEKRKNYYTMAALCNYYGSKRVESTLEEIMFYRKMNYKENQEILFGNFNLANTYHWTTVINRYKTYIAKNLKKIRKHDKYKSSYWAHLGVFMRENILEEALNNFEERYNSDSSSNCSPSSSCVSPPSNNDEPF